MKYEVLVSQDCSFLYIGSPIPSAMVLVPNTVHIIYLGVQFPTKRTIAYTYINYTNEWFELLLLPYG